MQFLCTPWDRRSVDIARRDGRRRVQGRVGDLPNLELLEAIASKGKPLIVSTACRLLHEIETTVAFLQSIGATFVLLHCNSSYPTAFKDVNLRFMQTLQSPLRLPGGLPGHELGIAVSEAAVVMGACMWNAT